MTTIDLNLLKTITDTNLKLFLEQIHQNVSEKVETIGELRNEVEDLKARVLSQEVYTSRDCLIFENLEGGSQF